MAIASALLTFSIAVPALLSKHFAAMCFAILGLLVAVGIGIGAIVLARKQHRRLRGLVVLTSLSVGGAIALVYQPASTLLLAIVSPTIVAIVPPADAQPDFDSHLRSLKVAHATGRVLQAEVHRSRLNGEVRCFYLVEVDAGQAQAMEDEILAGVASMGWKNIHDEGNGAVKSMPYASYPRWFDPKIYPDADCLFIGSNYLFVFCAAERRVFFSFETD